MNNCLSDKARIIISCPISSKNMMKAIRSSRKSGINGTFKVTEAVTKRLRNLK